MEDARKKSMYFDLEEPRVHFALQFVININNSY